MDLCITQGSFLNENPVSIDSAEIFLANSQVILLLFMTLTLSGRVTNLTLGYPIWYHQPHAAITHVDCGCCKERYAVTIKCTLNFEYLVRKNVK
jgi:hypothetical protein